MSDNRLRIEEVALFLGVSVETINIWYRFKKHNPDDEYAKMLPEFEQDNGAKSCRWWKQDDLDKFVQFQKSRPIGRNGAMGTVTQKYVKKKEA